MTGSEECAVAWLALASSNASGEGFRVHANGADLELVQVHRIPSQFFGSADFIKARPAMTQQTRE